MYGPCFLLRLKLLQHLWEDHIYRFGHLYQELCIYKLFDPAFAFLGICTEAKNKDDEKFSPQESSGHSQYKSNVKRKQRE